MRVKGRGLLEENLGVISSEASGTALNENSFRKTENLVSAVLSTTPWRQLIESNVSASPFGTAVRSERTPGPVVTQECLL